MDGEKKCFCGGDDVVGHVPQIGHITHKPCNNTCNHPMGPSEVKLTPPEQSFSDEHLRQLKEAVRKESRNDLDNLFMDWGDYKALLARLEAAEQEAIDKVWKEEAKQRNIDFIWNRAFEQGKAEGFREAKKEDRAIVAEELQKHIGHAGDYDAGARHCCRTLAEHIGEMKP